MLNTYDKKRNAKHLKIFSRSQLHAEMIPEIYLVGHPVWFLLISPISLYFLNCEYYKSKINYVFALYSKWTEPL